MGHQRQLQITQRSSSAIRRAIMGHQRLLALVSFAVLMREAISVHQRSSEVIRGSSHSSPSPSHS
jgi:hypothetical protein